MKASLKSIDGLIFLSYLTKYNIKEIYNIIETHGDIPIETFVDDVRKRVKSAAIDTKSIASLVDEALLCSYKLDYYNIKVETIYGPNYPAKLKKLKTPPPLLYFRGTLRRKKLVAIVGTRTPTKLAYRTIPLLVEVFNKHGYGIVSGLALGIDSIAHKASIEQRAYTLAVMPNSLDTIYPKENYDLANLILKGNGAIVSELAFGISHGKRSFVQRNRIQAGMSEIVLPVEMGIKSGTMTTVEFAYEQGKFILLVPPKGEYKKLEQFEGINHIIEKSKQEKYKRTYIINDLSELDQFLRDNQYVGQEKLF
jgi:DNA processing protein